MLLCSAGRSTESCNPELCICALPNIVGSALQLFWDLQLCLASQRKFWQGACCWCITSRTNILSRTLWLLCLIRPGLYLTSVDRFLRFTGVSLCQRTFSFHTSTHGHILWSTCSIKKLPALIKFDLTYCDPFLLTFALYLKELSLFTDRYIITVCVNLSCLK